MTRSVATLLSFVFCAVWINGCAQAQRSVEVYPADEPEATDAPESSPPAGEAASTGVEGNEVSSLERNDLRAVEKLVVRLSHGEVTLITGRPAKKGRLKVARLAGDDRCKARVAITESSVEITDGVKAAALSALGKSKSGLPQTSCRFGVELELSKAAETQIELTRGRVTAEGWKARLEVQLEWGDVALGQVGPVSVVCGRCNLAGEGVSGQLTYQLESGNVGLEGLESSVEGRTLGDTVLKWRRLPGSSQVTVLSKAGDVILFFPPSVPLAFDAKAPRGEVRTRLIDANRGVPVAVTAELGNVHMYRMPGKRPARR